jgi:hypothetical protein
VRLAVLASIAWGGDLFTAFLLPPGSEVNPVGAALLAAPLLAVAGKSATLSLACLAGMWHRPVLLLVLIAGTIGLVSNLRVVL